MKFARSSIIPKVFKEKHECQPKLESDLVSFSLRHFVHLWETGNMGVIEGRDEGQTIDNVRQPDTGEVVMWDQGWAEKRKQGEMYGKNFIAEVRDDFVEMFMQGVDGKSKKMNATQMLDCLKAKYPQRWELPSEAAIGSFLSSFSASQKKARGISESRKSKLPEEYLQFLKGLLDENPALQPRVGLQLFYSKFEGVVDKDDNMSKAIKSKISNLKQSRKKSSS